MPIFGMYHLCRKQSSAPVRSSQTLLWNREHWAYFTKNEYKGVWVLPLVGPRNVFLFSYLAVLR